MKTNENKNERKPKWNNRPRGIIAGENRRKSWSKRCVCRKCKKRRHKCYAMSQGCYFSIENALIETTK